MRFLSGLCSFFSWVFLVITTFIHVLLILTFTDTLATAIGQKPVENEVNARALPFVIVGFVLFFVAFFLFRYLRRGRWVWFAVAVAGSLILLGVGLYLKVQYPETILSNDRVSGYDSAFKLVYRHFLPLFVTLLELLRRVFRNKAEDNRLRREAVKDIKDEGFKPKFE